MSLLHEGLADGRLILGTKERQWLGRIDRELSGMPATEDDLLQEFVDNHGAEFDAASCALAGVPALL